MSKKRNRKKLPAASGAVWRQSAEEATLATKPLYNGFVCGHGAHGSKKYQRSKAKQAWQKQLRQEGAPRGSFLYGHLLLSGDIRPAWLRRFAMMALEEKGQAL